MTRPDRTRTHDQVHFANRASDRGPRDPFCQLGLVKERVKTVPTTKDGPSGARGR